MSKNYDVTALGELLIDFTENGISPQGNTLFEANPGGAPCNVLAMLSRFGHRTAFIGKVGEDMFGGYLRKTLSELEINTNWLLADNTTRTTLAFVKNLKDGEREFSFYRNPGADMMLTEKEIDETLLADTRIFHFGTLSMTHESVRRATIRAVKAAKAQGALISFDPNLREPLWDSLKTAREQVSFGLEHCDILKISDNEIIWFTGEADLTAGIKKLQKAYPIPLILLSMGGKGSRAYCGAESAEAPAFFQENPQDTTGAGDTFLGCCLHYILENGMQQLNNERLKEMLTTANGAASIITGRKGALRVMPTISELENFLKARRYGS